jgi:hypothetical protein
MSLKEPTPRSECGDVRVSVFVMVMQCTGELRVAEEDQTEGSAVIGESVKGAWYFGHVDREVFPNDEE